MPAISFSRAAPSDPVAVQVGDVVENRSSTAVWVCAQATFSVNDAVTLPPGGLYRVEAAGNIRARGVTGNGKIIVARGL